METAGNQNWFLRKHADGSVFGPLAFEQVRRWANAAQIAPHNKISRDETTWLKAPMFPELQMDWLVELTSERYYGPTTLGAVREFMRLGEISDDTCIINSCDGTRCSIRDVPELMAVPEETDLDLEGAPPAISMSIDVRDRINDLEQTLEEERRALAECEARYRALEARYNELLAGEEETP